MPQRIQRKRTKGWRMPEGAIYVGRPTRWGNPFTIVNAHRQGWVIYDDRDRLGLAPAGQSTSDGFIAAFATREEAQRHAVRLYRKWLLGSQARVSDLQPILAGHDLACFCQPSWPCHADVLLELANRGDHA